MKKYLAILAVALLAPLAANAGTITYYTPNTNTATGSGTVSVLYTPTTMDAAGYSPLNSNLKILEYLNSAVPDFDPEVYKSDVDGGEDGGFTAAAWYTTTYMNSPLDPEDALIEWDGPGIIDPQYMLVKNGSTDPQWYLFDVSNWNGTDDVMLADFWVGNGAISHISIFGGIGDDCCIRVPEPGPLGLLGLGMIALYVARRRRLAS